MHRRALLVALVGGPLVLWGCGSNPGEDAAPAGTAVSGARSARSGWGGYRVTWTPVPDPIPVGALVRLEIAVASTDGAAPPEVTVDVDATMPDHGHGMTLRPRVVRTDDGRFVAEGLLFHMAGRWELAVDVRRGDDVERVTFPLELE